MIAATKGFVRKAGLVLAVSLPLTSTQAHAVTVTVGGTSYELSAVNTSFAANTTLLQGQPWWSNSTLAFQFATELARTGIPLSPGFGLFAYGTSGSNVDVVVAGSGAPFYTSGTQSQGGPFVTATASASSVPEINAGSLSQALLILFALWLVTWRRTSSRVA